MIKDVEKMIEWGEILSYLWGIETSKSIWNTYIKFRFYLTYEELKLGSITSSNFLLSDFILPMRNWNF